MMTYQLQLLQHKFCCHIIHNSKNTGLEGKKKKEWKDVEGKKQ